MHSIQIYDSFSDGALSNFRLFAVRILCFIFGAFFRNLFQCILGNIQFRSFRSGFPTFGGFFFLVLPDQPFSEKNSQYPCCGDYRAQAPLNRLKGPAVFDQQKDRVIGEIADNANQKK